MKSSVWNCLRSLTMIAIGLSVIVIVLFNMGQSGSSTSYENGPLPADRVVKSESEWKKILTKEQYHVCREKGTERAFTGKYWDYHGKGMFKCVCCGQPLFKSSTKFDSGTGWPSFWDPATADAVRFHEDRKIPFMPRVEVTCSKCDAHLGHVFEDGPAPTHKRYCINSVCLKVDEDSSK